MCCVKEKFVQIKEHREKIQLAADNYVYSEGIGVVVIETSARVITLRDVLYVPKLKSNFLSMSKAAKCGNSIILNDSSATITNSSGAKVISAKLCESLYVYEDVISTAHSYGMSASEVNNNNNYIKWHERYGHLNIRSLKCLTENNLVRGIELKNIPNSLDCETCFKGKICVLPFA